jgi:hypothetical protein
MNLKSMNQEDFTMKKIFYSALAALFILMGGVMFSTVSAGTLPTPAKTPAPGKAPMIDKEKNTYVMKVEVELNSLDHKIKSAEAKADKAEAGEKTEVIGKINELKTEHAAAVTKLDTLRKTETSDWKTMEKDLNDSVAKIQSDYEAMIGSSKLFAQEEKTAYVNGVRARLNVADRKLLALETKAAKAEGAAKTGLNQQVTEAKSDLASARKDLEKLETSTGDDWKQLKGSVDKELEELEAKLKM